MLKCLRCKLFDYDKMIHNRAVYLKAQRKMDKDCDLIDIMEQVRGSKNFLRNFLTREQKILLKYDVSNIIDGEHAESDEEEILDFDDIIANNLQSDNGLVAMFTLVKLGRILNPYTQNGKLNYFDKNLFVSFYT